MFKFVKKKVKNIGDSIHGRNNEKENERHDTGNKLNTPARRYTGGISTSSPSEVSVGTTISYQIQSDQVSRETKPRLPKSSANRKTRNNKKETMPQMKEADVDSKILHLSKFDTCIQASDALAAASGLSDHHHAKQEESILDEVRIDESTGLPLTCILVSPDGYMLLIPPPIEGKDVEKQSSPVPEAGGFGGNLNAIEHAQPDSVPSTKHDKSEVQSEEAEGTPYEDDNHSDSVANFSKLRFSCKDDYASSVYVGHDLHPEGDKALNGFSAKGWSIPATSLALEQTEQTLNAFAHFCEQMILSRKESAARTGIACDNLREATASIRKGKAPSQDTSDSWVLIDPHTIDFAVTPSRTGPLLAKDSTIAKALVAIEEYYNSECDKEADRWRSASLQRDELLPKIHDATDQLHERSVRRQLALEESSRRVKMLEDRVQALQQVADTKWRAVCEAEERVTIKQQKLIEERRQLREVSRLQKLKREEAIRLQETASVNKGTATLGATNKEIWDLVSSLADSASDMGSFEPIDYPTAPLTAPRDKSAMGTNGNDLSIDSLHSEATSNSFDSAYPVASREELSIEQGIPKLRSAAFEADRAVRDTADTLLNVLSTLDTTRRSARIAAETCLLSAANAQAKCIQTWVQLERIALQDRLAGLEVLDKKLQSTLNVRADLDSYIRTDKKERGGSSHLGDDDDGGIASALAILSSHVDGIDRDSSNGYSRTVQTDKDTGVDDDIETINELEISEAINLLFEHKHEFENTCNFDSSVQLLCRVGKAKSRAVRSSLCYGLNAKRSSNARIQSKGHFDALCTVFDAILSGCSSEVEAGGGVSIAKMCMMLSQTFYLDGSNDTNCDSFSTNQDLPVAAHPRSCRIYVKNKLIQHPIWSKDDYWDIALAEQISESLTHSGVMSNFERSNAFLRNKNNEYVQPRKTQWYDVSQTERLEAASQVHAVISAQLGALAHSMLEFGCGLERACAFVRRMSIRNQLPSSHRTMLLMHLMERDDIEK